MTFREALEREIAVQGLSVTEIAQISGVSKGAIYNILNNTTEEDRIRPATRRAIARGCGRAVRVAADGGVVFVDQGQGVEETPADDAVRLSLSPGRPFLDRAHIREGFDWAFAREDEGELRGTRIVDRVYQKREDFLSLVVENGLGENLAVLQFDLDIAYVKGPSARLPVRCHPGIGPGERWEASLFLCVGPAFRLTIENASYTTEGGATGRLAGPPGYTHPGEIRA